MQPWLALWTHSWRLLLHFLLEPLDFLTLEMYVSLVCLDCLFKCEASSVLMEPYLGYEAEILVWGPASWYSKGTCCQASPPESSPDHTVQGENQFLPKGCPLTSTSVLLWVLTTSEQKYINKWEKISLKPLGSANEICIWKSTDLTLCEQWVVSPSNGQAKS